MTDVVVHAVQSSSVQCWAEPGGLAENVAATLAAYGEAADDADLVVFPELGLTGYVPLKGYDQARKRTLAEVGRRVVDDALPKLAAATRGRRGALVVGFTEPSSMRHEMHNAVALLEDGAVRAVYRKMHLPVEENHYFVPGDQVVVADTHAGRVGLAICYDLVFPEVGRMAALHGAETLVVPSNWLAIADLERLGEVLPVARALEQQLHVVFVNGVGELTVRGRTWSLYGGSRIVSASGRVVAQAGSGHESLTGTLPAADLADAAGVFPVLRDRRPDLYGDLVAPLSRFASLTPRTPA